MNNIENLKFLIKRSNYLYKHYLNDPLYVNALLIKSVNKKIIKFLYENGGSFQNQGCVNTILDHFLIWYFQFENLEREKFKLQDVFKFERIEQSLAYPDNEIKTILKEKL